MPLLLLDATDGGSAPSGDAAVPVGGGTAARVLRAGMADDVGVPVCR